VLVGDRADAPRTRVRARARPSARHRTVWRSIKPLLEALAADESRFDGVTTLGVDEHVWHHVSTKPEDQGGRGPKELTGMVDLSRDAKGKVRARLLDLVPGRTGAAYRQWLAARNDAFRAGIDVATLDPFHGYKNAIDDQLDDAVAVLDGFHIIKLGTDAVDRCRRRVQQDIHGHRGRKGDPLYGIRLILRCGEERLTDKQKARLDKAIAVDERHNEIYAAYQCAQQLRAAYTATSLAEGRKIAEQVVATFPTCPIPEIARLGRNSSNGSQRSSPTSTPGGRTTAALKPSTASSSCIAASPAASATATTTGYECCSSAQDSTLSPTGSKKSRQSAPDRRLSHVHAPRLRSPSVTNLAVRAATRGRLRADSHRFVATDKSTDRSMRRRQNH
jgi:Transposase